METVFTPWISLAGGGLIGLGAVILMASLGRIMGATGILTGALTAASAAERGWRLAVLAGMVSGPLVLFVFTRHMPEITSPASLPVLALGGVIVGIGVSFASGCTSGHGICGLARLSPRSLAATATFMAMTALTVFVIRHVIGG